MDLQFVLSGKSGRDGIDQAIQTLLDAPALSNIVIRTQCEYLVKSLPLYRGAVASGFPFHDGTPDGFPDNDLWKILDECCRRHRTVFFLLDRPHKPVVAKKNTLTPSKKESSILFPRTPSITKKKLIPAAQAIPLNVSLDWRDAKQKLISILNDGSVHIYCDGSYKSGYIGWGAVFVGENENHIQIGGNFRCDAPSSGVGAEYSELLSIVCSLEFLPESLAVTVYSDCLFLLSRITKGNFRTKLNGINSCAWERLQNVCKQHKIKWEWIKGHDGHKYNELADKIANEQRRILEKANKPILLPEKSICAFHG